MEQFGSTVGERIKLARQKKKLNQQHLAEKLGVKTSTVGSYEIGRSNPSLEILAKISDECEVSIDWLVKGQENNADSHLSTQSLDKGAFGAKVELQMLKTQLEKAEKLNEEYLQIIRNFSQGKDEVIDQQAGDYADYPPICQRKPDAMTKQLEEAA